MIYEDSPQLCAVRHGRVLLLDETDKVPLEVLVCILKSLAEDAEFTLADGRTMPKRVPSQAVEGTRLNRIDTFVFDIDQDDIPTNLKM